MPSEAFHRVYSAAMDALIVAMEESQHGGMTVGEHDETAKVYRFLQDFRQRHPECREGCE